MSPKAKRLILGIATILAALATAVVAYLDNDPGTVVKPGAVIEEVREGVEVIRSEDEVEVLPLVVPDGSVSEIK